MTNAVIQFYVPFNGVGKDILKKHFPEEQPEWSKASNRTFKKYAEKYDADYLFYTNRYVKATSNFFEVCRIFLDPSLDFYDNILYADCDVLVKNDSENIFDELGDYDVAGVPESRVPEYKVSVDWNASGALRQRFEDFGSRLVKPETVDSSIRMINSGVMVWSRAARQKARMQFDNHNQWFHHKNALLDIKWRSAGHSSHCLDQPYLNAMWTKYDFRVKELNFKWNRFPTHDEDFHCNFAHYVQDERFRMPEIEKSSVSILPGN